MPLILLVEDDLVFRQVLARVVEAEGFAVIQADDGEAAVQLIARHRPDVTLLDIMLPIKDGLEVILDVQRAHYRTRIIAMSGGGRDRAGEFFTLVEKLGVDGILRKPFSNADLIRAIRKVLNSGTDTSETTAPPATPKMAQAAANEGDVDLRYDGAAYRTVPLSDRGRDWLFIAGIPKRIPLSEARYVRSQMIGQGLEVLIDGQVGKL